MVLSLRQPSRHLKVKFQCVVALERGLLEGHPSGEINPISPHATCTITLFFTLSITTEAQEIEDLAGIVTDCNVRIWCNNGNGIQLQK